MSLRLMLAGVLDRFPGLQLIVGHMGEVLPFMIERATGALGRAIALDASNTRWR
jgi:predicted TIM-barrel fold metal-dependent hydrolase